jgi:DnaJ-class molecular chaperone
MSLWKRIVRAIVRAKCPDCNGTGYHVVDSGCSCLAVEYVPCKLCRGEGRV